MRAGRVFLAGDAAHQMPPFLGQGMCSGIRDAVSLAWRLDLVERGVAGDSLLDTYDAERRPHAAAIVEHAVDTGRLIDQLAGRADHGIDLDSAYGGGRPFPTLDAGLRWGDHPAVGRQVPNPLVDGRRLDDLLAGRFGLVVDSPSTAEPVAGAWGELATIVCIDPSAMPFTLPAGGAAIVRPDRSVAAVAEHAADLVAASRELLSTIRG